MHSCRWWRRCGRRRPGGAGVGRAARPLVRCSGLVAIGAGVVVPVAVVLIHRLRRRSGGVVALRWRRCTATTAGWSSLPLGLSSPASVADILGLGFWPTRRVIDRNSSATRRLLSKPQQLQPLAQQIRVAGCRDPSARRPRCTPSTRRSSYLSLLHPARRPSTSFTSSRGAGR